MRFTPKPITLVDLLVSLNNTPAADGELVVDRADVAATTMAICSAQSIQSN